MAHLPNSQSYLTKLTSCLFFTKTFSYNEITIHLLYYYLFQIWTWVVFSFVNWQNYRVWFRNTQFCFVFSFSFSYLHDSCTETVLRTGIKYPWGWWHPAAMDLEVCLHVCQGNIKWLALVSHKVQDGMQDVTGERKTRKRLWNASSALLGA